MPGVNLLKGLLKENEQNLQLTPFKREKTEH